LYRSYRSRVAAKVVAGFLLTPVLLSAAGTASVPVERETDDCTQHLLGLRRPSLRRTAAAVPRPHDPRPVPILIRSRFRGYSKRLARPSEERRPVLPGSRPGQVVRGRSHQGTAYAIPLLILRKVSVVKTGRGRRPIQPSGCQGSGPGRTKRILAIPVDACVVVRADPIGSRSAIARRPLP
jgi:hypothetical protein